MRFYTHAQQQSGKIYVRGYENGERFTKKVPYQPTLFIPSTEPSDWTTLEGEKVSPIKFDSISDCRDFLDQYKDVDNFPIYGQTRHVYGYLAETYPEQHMSWSIDHVRIDTLDIEVASDEGFPEPQQAAFPVTAISLMDRATKQITSWGCGDYKPHHENIVYHKCANEAELLRKFMEHWVNDYPDVVTGWNIDEFDIPYLINRIFRILGEAFAKRFAPWGVNAKEVSSFGNTIQLYELRGIAILDYRSLYKKFTYSAEENYRLDTIAAKNLGEKKTDYSEYENLFQLYKLNFQLFMEYNTRDVWLVYKLENKLRMIELAITMAFDAKINFQDIYAQTRFWDNVIYNTLLHRKVAIPPQPKYAGGEAYRGAFVIEPKPGLYKWVVGFDATSLYPSLIMQYNISPETVAPPETDQDYTVEQLLAKEPDLEWLKGQGYGMAINGVCFSNAKEGLFPELVRRFFDERQMFKKKMLEAKKQYEATKDPQYETEAAKYEVYQMARKISLNSLYGAVGSSYFRYHSVRQAEAITVSGQLIIQKVKNAANAYLNRLLKNTEEKNFVVAGDTDSIYIAFDDLVQTVFPNRVEVSAIVDFLDKICKDKIQGMINDAAAEVAEYTNAYKNAISFKREKIADSGIWTGKKRYILRVYDNEGVRYKEPEIEVTGIEMVRSSTPEVVRAMLKKAIWVTLNDIEADLHKTIRELEVEFNQYLPEDIAFPRSANNLAKYRSAATIYTKGTPMQVRAALLYNSLLVKFKQEKKYPAIKEGDKIKFIYLKTPNSIGENTIAFVVVLPKEFGLHQYVDYNTMFEKTFVEPMTTILDAIGWTPRMVNKIDSLFD